MSAFTQLINAGSRILHAQAGEEITIVTPGGGTVPCTGLVDTLRTGREMDDAENIKRVWTGHVSLTFSANPQLAELIAAEDRKLPSEKWKVQVRGKQYKLANPSADATAWEFDIKELI